MVMLCAASSLMWAQAGAGKQAKGGDKGAQPPPAPQEIKQLKPGLFLVTGAGGNTSVRVTKAGLIVVDTKNLGDAFYNELMEKIRSVSQAPVKYVVVTHHHQDHSGNIQKFKDSGAIVIAHEGLAKALETYAPPQGKPGQPSKTYSKIDTVKLGGAKVQLYHFGRGHTGGDTIVYYPDLKVVQTGDVVVGIVPNIDYPFGGSALEWQTTLESIAKLNFDTLIPGHSAPNATTMTKGDFLAYKKKFDTVVARAKELVKQGTPKDQLIAKIKTDDLGWNINNQQWNQPARVDAFYEEMMSAK
jgi:glyoxylase-like metal-dependent hydrolase (beta-lactamase superfamily II)